MNFEILPLEAKHLEEAAVLTAWRFREERKRVNLLPVEYEKPEMILSLMKGFSKNGPGVCAMKQGRLEGFLQSRLFPMDKGFSFAYIPEYCHAVMANGRDVYRAMYTGLSRIWASQQCASQAITILAHDKDALEAWFTMGFGMTGVDALRDFSLLQGNVADIKIRRADVEDVEVLLAQDMAINHHLAAPPIYRPLEEESPELHEQWLKNPLNALWLAEHEGETVAGMGLEPFHTNASTIIRAEKTISITTAFTREKRRGQGIARVLLDHALKWAKSAGYQRCAVDFESANISGSGFWLGQGFEPVCYSLRRRVPRELLGR
jgi:GNAT superfamily N-acetyltransferase